MTDAADTALPVATGRQSGREVWRISRGHRLKLAAGSGAGSCQRRRGLCRPRSDRVPCGWCAGGHGRCRHRVVGVREDGGRRDPRAVGSAVTIVLAARAYHAILAELRERLVKHAMRLPQRIVERAGTGDLGLAFQ